MKQLLLVFLLLLFFAIPAQAQEPVLPDVPSDAAGLLPEDRDTFSEGLWYVITSAFGVVQPQLADSGRAALSIVAAAMLTGVLGNVGQTGKNAVNLAGIVCVACLLMQPADAHIASATETVTQLSEYGKLLLPVMTAALAAQGGTATSAALYAATIGFDALLSMLIQAVLVPMVYLYLVLAVVHAAVDDSMIKRLRDLMKSIMTWSLKVTLYFFTAYIGISGVVSGTVDQSAVKAAKLTISGMVPVVGSILSDASEAVLVSAGLVKNAAGLSGMLAIVAITIVPFLRIGLQYLALKLTAALCSIISDRRIATLIEDVSSAMGLLLGMTGAMCLMLLISLVCFLRGVG